ncbi:MAG: hypothetical protein OSJ54_06670 [Oscillospiraceae bacterium]|nr:hypothetical protein [Oscillospiraceae bacterium]
MIKGVNKRVVEITSTDHEYFEKAVLYVKSDKSDVPAERLGEEARMYLGKIVPAGRRREIPLVFKLAAASVMLVLILLVIFLAVCVF